jgi:hypothetical protein
MASLLLASMALQDIDLGDYAAEFD